MEQQHVEALSTGVARSKPDFPVFVSGQGCWLRAADGPSYFDGTCGFGAVALGHQHGAVVEAVTAQVARLAHTGCKTRSRVRDELIERLGAFSPYERTRILPTATGAEAVESAIKIARAFTGRSRLVAFRHAYHGKTTGALAVTWRDELKSYSAVEGRTVLRARYPVLHSGRVEDGEEACLAELAQLLEAARREGDLPAAVILEPVQITEGVLPAGTRFLEGVIAAARAQGVLVVFDEIYTGFGRCDASFCCAALAAKPDLLLVGKGLSNGFPIAAVVGPPHIVDALPAGVQTSTYSGHPVSCAAALAVLEVMRTSRPWEGARIPGDAIRGCVRQLQDRHAWIASPRSSGMVFAFDCRDERTGAPAPARARQFVETAQRNRLLLLGGSFDGSAVKLVTPLLMTDGDVQRLVEALELTARQVETGP